MADLPAALFRVFPLPPLSIRILMTRIIISEKPSMGRAIASALGIQVQGAILSSAAMSSLRGAWAIW